MFDKSQRQSDSTTMGRITMGLYTMGRITLARRITSGMHTQRTHSLCGFLAFLYSPGFICCYFVNVLVVLKTSYHRPDPSCLWARRYEQKSTKEC